ncbi:MAG: hypothetical protein R3348_06735 [Xanthomonadales bacterium]|nr:hypothetical protein [Xanthomonadales bacterium]
MLNNRFNLFREGAWAACLGLALVACSTTGPQIGDVGGAEMAADSRTEPAPVIELSDPVVAQEPAAEAAEPAGDGGAVVEADETPAAEPGPTPTPDPGAPTAVEEGPARPAADEPAPVVVQPAQVSKPAPVPKPPATAPVTEQVAEQVSEPAPVRESPSARRPDDRAPVPGNVSKPAAVAAEATLDLPGLETRLRKTKAIGVFTKLELKSQVNDLLGDIEAYHAERSRLSLSQIEQRFNLLVMKLLVLLEEDDPQLHREIASARPALWTTLADPDQFSSVKGP